MRTYVARALASLVVLLVPPSVQAAGVAPTAFESFVTNPATVVAASREIGALTSLDSTVRVTALAGVAAADAAKRMRGVRFALSNNGGREQIFLSERQLERLLEELDLMEFAKDKALGQPQGAAHGGMLVHGTESCWMPNPVQRILCPELRRAATWSGLQLWTFGGAVFEFRDRDSADLRELVERALTAVGQL